MAFKFKLESVLNYRQILEDQAQQALAESQQERLRLERQSIQLKERLLAVDRELKKRQLQGIGIAELTLYEDQIEHCQRQVKQLEELLVRIRKRIEDQRQELLQASMERQVMEKLKEKMHAEYLRAEARAETSLLDEISLRTKGSNRWER
jgi:flagellar FliJ protein